MERGRWEGQNFQLGSSAPGRRRRLSNVTYITDFPLGGPEDWVIWIPSPPPLSSGRHSGGQNLKSREVQYLCWVMWSDIAVQCAPISQRPLLCLKFSSLRPLVLLIRVVWRWRWVWSSGWRILTGKNRSTGRITRPGATACNCSWTGWDRTRATPVRGWLPPIACSSKLCINIQFFIVIEIGPFPLC